MRDGTGEKIRRHDNGSRGRGCWEINEEAGLKAELEKSTKGPS